MEQTRLDMNVAKRTESDETKVSSLYAAASARIVVTSKRRFTTSFGAQQLTGEAMTLGYVQGGDDGSLESSLESLFDNEAETSTFLGWPDTQTAGAVLDPDVLLAWILTEGVSERH